MTTANEDAAIHINHGLEYPYDVPDDWHIKFRGMLINSYSRSCSPCMGGSVVIYDEGPERHWRYRVVQKAFLHPDHNVSSCETIEEAREAKRWAQDVIRRHRYPHRKIVV